MTPRALSVFVAEDRLHFPIGIDMPRDRLPHTMKVYALARSESAKPEPA